MTRIDLGFRAYASSACSRLSVLCLLIPVGLLAACPGRAYEALGQPRMVASVEVDGTVLFDDGSSIRVPALAAMTHERDVLAMLMRNGVEVEPDGSVWVAVDIYSNCSRAPQGDERRRVQLDLLLEFVEDPSVLRAAGEPPVGVNRKGIAKSTWLVFEEWRLRR